MASWDNPSVAAPGGASYAAPLLDFSPIGNLPGDYYKGQQARRQNELAQTFANGLPRDAAGNPDYARAGEMLAERGDVSQLVPLANVDLQRKFLNSALTDSNAAFPVGPPAQAAMPQDTSTPGGAPQGSPQPAPRMLTPAPAGGVPQRAEIPPNGIPAPRADNKRSIPGGDDGQTTLMSIVANKIGDDATAGPIALKLAQTLKLDPNASNDPVKAANIAKYVDGYLKRNAIGPQTSPGAPDESTAAAPDAEAQPQTSAQPQASPAGAPIPAALRPMIPAQFSDPLQYVNFLRQKQAAYERAGLAGIKGADGAAKAYGAQADKVMDAIGKYYELTPEQKNATASGGLNPLQFKNQEQQGRVAAENRALTPEQKNARGDARQGETDAEYQARVAGGKKFAEGEAERFGKKYEAITKAGAESAAELPKLALAKQYMASPDFYSGPAEGLTLAYKRVLATVDPSQANSAAPQEAFRKIISDSVRSQIRSLAESGVGRISIPEVRIIEKAAANQENTPAANRLLVELSSRMHQQTLGLDELARSYNGGRLDPGFDTAARAWVQQHPIVTPAELKDPRLIAPPVFATPDAVRAAGLAKGAPFQTPDGRTKYVP